MNWKRYWDGHAARHSGNLQDQVARTIGGQPATNELTATVAGDIAAKLELGPDDDLLDVCCGNGLLTVLHAARCRSVVGVDLSAVQIQSARQFNTRLNATYLLGDALQLRAVVAGTFSRIVLYFSFQYFDTFEKGQRAVLQMLEMLRPGGVLLLGDVPDRDRFANFRTTPLQRMRHHALRVVGLCRMGKFWHLSELERICSPVGAAVEKLDQSFILPYAHYRCDFRIRPASRSQSVATAPVSPTSAK